MSAHILLLTAGIELGLVVGYGLNWIHDCRRMVWAMVSAIPRRSA
jgi:hypothetical protein